MHLEIQRSTESFNCPQRCVSSCGSSEQSTAADYLAPSAFKLEHSAQGSEMNMLCEKRVMNLTRHHGLTYACGEVVGFGMTERFFASAAALRREFPHIRHVGSMACAHIIIS